MGLERGSVREDTGGRELDGGGGSRKKGVVDSTEERELEERRELEGDRREGGTWRELKGEKRGIEGNRTGGRGKPQGN
jgi:hypothetical protein